MSQTAWGNQSLSSFQFLVCDRWHPISCSSQEHVLTSQSFFSVCYYYSHTNNATELIYSYEMDFSQCFSYNIFTKRKIRLYFTKGTLKPGLVFSSWTHELPSIFLSYPKRILIIESLLAWHKAYTNLQTPLMLDDWPLSHTHTDASYTDVSSFKI